jgi:hypothetical protein
MNNENDKIDVEDLIKDFLILNIDSLSKYLKAIWKVKYYIYNSNCRTFPKEVMTR